MKRNNQRGAQRPQNLRAQALENRGLLGLVKAILRITDDEGVLAKTSSQLSGRSIAKPVPTWRANGHHPHQGHQEKARRIRQGLAGLNCNNAATIAAQEV